MQMACYDCSLDKTQIKKNNQKLTVTNIGVECISWYIWYSVYVYEAYKI